MAKKKAVVKRPVARVAAKAKAAPPAPKSAPAPTPMAPGAFVDKFKDHASFYASVRQAFGPLRQLQVDGFENIFRQWAIDKFTDIRWLAYQLATVWHETAATMQPIVEYGKGKGRAYGKPDRRTGLIYYGRGLVQLTHYDNYKKYNIERDPERACDPEYAAFIMSDGMSKGVFTGKKLSDYFSATKNSPVGARAIINGKDRAALIAGHHNRFLAALKGFEAVPVTVAKT